jgi:hypothetical protein
MAASLAASLNSIEKMNLFSGVLKEMHRKGASPSSRS